ncbi:MAG: glycerate kinase [Micropruina sp.]|uniref:glycerate kinase n=1 Tax=Micropruina sp. TaxID=2737536 RepID=UPI0039E57FB7
MAERRPRVLLASAGVAELTPRAAAVALARGFRDAAEVAVIGLAEGGRALGQALAEPDGEWETLRTGWLARRPGLLAVGADASGGEDRAPDDPLTGSSAALGRLVAYALQTDQALHAERTPTVAIDLTELDVHDAGAGLLGALGACADVALDAGTAPFAAIGRLELDAVRARFAGCDLVGLVPPGELEDQLLGLRGITSRRGRALGTPAERMLAVDAALERFAGLASPDHARAPGAGAAGGLGFAVLALGGRLATGAAFCADRAGLDRGLAAADLVVTACDSFDFGSRGGGVVTELARRCEAAETPLVVVSPLVGMSGREMRVMGVESGHPLEPGADTTAALTATGRRLASGWASRW